MREYLFKGKDVKGNWHIGLLAHFGNAWYISNSAGVSTAFEVIPETVGQFTGMTDKNEKKIFEGDVVKGEFLWRDIVGQVVWGEYSHSKCDEYSCEHYGWYVKPIREVKNNLYKNTGWDLYSMGMVEVIDNIHDTEGGAE